MFLGAVLGAVGFGSAGIASSAGAQIAQFEVFGFTFLEFLDDDTGDSLGTVGLDVTFTFDVDTSAAETSLNNFSQAATNPSIFISVFESSFDDPADEPDLSDFPFFSTLPGSVLNPPTFTPNDIGDAFVGFNEFGINFPTFVGNFISDEPTGLSLLFTTPIADGDLPGVVSLLQNSNDPTSLIDTENSSITYQGPLGPDFEDDLFFEVSGINVVPEPASMVLLAGGAWLVAGSRRRRSV
jgi:hypothetical protein